METIFLDEVSAEFLKNKKVFLRADLNVPTLHGKVLNDFKLNATKPTIDFILNSGGTIVLATHIGNPKAPNDELSTKILLPWFERNGYNMRDEILLLENLRFSPEEKIETKVHCDIYVNDSFGTAHRSDYSLTILPRFFAKDKRFLGLLVKREIEALSKLKETERTFPAHPFVIILGGAKAEKLNLIERFLDSPLKPDFILLGSKLGKLYKGSDPRVIAPLDFINSQASLFGDIGPKSIEKFCEIITSAKKVLLNGTLGIYEEDEFSTGTKAVLDAIANSDAFSVIAGGDAVASVFKFGLETKMNFLSTGGGATLEFLLAQDWKTLPGLFPPES